MSGLMTPESLSREGSPSPAGEITLHAAPGVTGQGGVLSASVPASSVVQSVAVEHVTGPTLSGISGQNAINHIVGTSLEVKNPAFNGGPTLATGNAAPRKHILNFLYLSVYSGLPSFFYISTSFKCNFF